MTIITLEIEGYRGFATRQSIQLAVPDGKEGSGLTVIVGPNNAGKSTIVEALRMFGTNQAPSFMEGKRNKTSGDRVRLRVTHRDGRSQELRTVSAGGAESEFDHIDHDLAASILALPSRRYFQPFFGRSTNSRQGYAGGLLNTRTRGSSIDSFTYRLFEIQKNQDAFNSVLARVLNPVPRWHIDQADSGEYFLKFETCGLYHNSDGLGDGLVSLLFIVDALYDSQDGQVVAIDEPELSLHPTLQRRLAGLLSEYSKTRQIVVSTHSPYFLPISMLAHGASIARVSTAPTGSRISQLSRTTANKLNGMLGDLHNPHVLGLDAREVFFLEDAVILVEGQEDVLFYQRMATEVGLPFTGAFFGWGVGGASKMAVIAAVLKDLGFLRVFGILDGNQEVVLKSLREEYSQYKFECIPTTDVRCKAARLARDPVEGMLTGDGRLVDKYRSSARALIEAPNEAMNGEGL